ncbi:MAG: glutamine-hydrolyzing carbamoyl-phosphate synthase small subunit [Myxococcota bacterium]|jgi:carbamoyl-phosphate synthase small subunit|nr:glutamine-hydrolyzing carbamoyl-phosphate synthase small subunit [Myxococcota bacterium]
MTPQNALPQPTRAPGPAPTPARLVLADGTIYRGQAFGAQTCKHGEVVFNTSMTGYQEIVTDPSYAGQIVAMTYTQIGNVGVNSEDTESRDRFLSGFVIKELSAAPSNYRSEGTLSEHLAEAGVPGIQGIDTRALVRRIRDKGAQVGVLSTDPAQQDEAALLELARKAPGLDGRDLVAEVTCDEPYSWDQGRWSGIEGQLPRKARPDEALKLVAYDFGVKRNILRLLVDHGFDVTVVPATTPAEEALAMKPDAIFFSNGPGDPAAVEGVQDNVRRLVREKPTFGICLGHQILGLALGGQTRKLKFGHHGGNQPGQDLATKKVAICAENHGYAVEADSLRAAGEPVEITHINLNDDTVEGLAHRELPLFSVQYHPEASPGPHDAGYLFGRFRNMVERVIAGESVSGAEVCGL